MEKIIIGLSANIKYEENKLFSGYKYSCISQNYIDCIIETNAIPLILPITKDRNVIKAYIEQIDGLLLSGGYDISPSLYNQAPSQFLGETYPERDEFELLLISEACKQQKPILGIGRGLQLINTGFGGTLLQDISLKNRELLKHKQESKIDIPTHFITLEGILKENINSNKILVNSYHHQIIDNLAFGFEVVAKSEDEVIEAIHYSNDKLWLLGIQWNPEMMKDYESSKKIFTLFTNTIKERKEKI